MVRCPPADKEMKADLWSGDAGCIHASFDDSLRGVPWSGNDYKIKREEVRWSQLNVINRRTREQGTNLLI